MYKAPQPRLARWLTHHVSRLLVVGLALVAIGAWLLAASESNKVLVTLGAAMLGAGVTMFITDVTSRRAVQEQYAKDANLRRRDQVYGPLHSAWPELMSDATNQDTKAAALRLSRQLIETEHMLKAGLTKIQDRFEGGPPII